MFDFSQKIYYMNQIKVDMLASKYLILTSELSKMSYGF